VARTHKMKRSFLAAMFLAIGLNMWKYNPWKKLRSGAIYRESSVDELHYASREVIFYLEKLISSLWKRFGRRIEASYSYARTFRQYKGFEWTNNQLAFQV
jgi:hypothetical protein